MRGLFYLSFYFFVLKKSILTQTHKERGINMSIPRKTYDFPKESINVLNPSSQHTKAIADLTDIAQKNYTPVKPMMPALFPRTGIKYTSAAEVTKALSEASELQNTRDKQRGWRNLPERIRDRIEDAPISDRSVFSRMDKSLRANADEMLKLLKYHPEILPFLDESLRTKEFYIKALEQNAKVYDLLSPQMQQDQDIINQYAKTVLRDQNLVDITRGGYASRSCYVPEINPQCPMDKFATPELYKQEMLKALQRQDLTHVSEVHSRDFDYDYCYVGKTETNILALRNLAPHLDFEKLDMELFHESREILLENATPLQQNHILNDFIEKYGLYDFKQEYEAAALANMQRPKVERPTSSVPSWEEQRKAQKQEEQQKIARGERLSIHPEMLKEEQKAIDLKEKIEKNPLGNFDKEVISMMTTAPDVVRKYIDFGAYIQQVARIDVAANAGELLQPLRPGENAQEVLQATQKRCEDFFTALQYHCSYECKYTYTMARDRAISERDKFTQKEKDFRCAQQMAFESPRGSTLADREILIHMRSSSPEEYAAHLDVKEYLDRRTTFLFAHSASAPRESETFKTMVSKSPEATAIVTAKLTQMGVKDPEKWLETAESKFQFSHSTKPSFNRDTDRNDPILETGDIGRQQ